MIHQMGLEMNPKKELLIKPGDAFDFLGFSVNSRGIDLSEATIRKTMGKISRSARRLRRWMIGKNAPLKGTLSAWFKDWNDMFYGHSESEFTWSRWFFPVVNLTDGMNKIDRYLQMWARFIPKGRHCKKDYSIVTYEFMKKCGYRPLIHAYYEYKGGRINS